MAADVRISTALADHPKTRKLQKKLGKVAGWNLVRLFAWAAQNRSDGSLSGMSAEDIELAADWDGEEGAFVETLTAVRFLDGEPEAYRIHDWAEHNPWAAGSEMRSAKARWNAVKRHHGEAEADRQVPEYAEVRGALDTRSIPAGTPASNADSTAPSINGSNTDSTAPSPLRLPTVSSPSPTLFAEQPAAVTAIRVRKAPDGKTVATWEAYEQAFVHRYGVHPIRNAQVNGMLANLVRSVGEQAPALAASYVRSEDRLYVQQKHPVNLLVRDAQKLLVELAQVPTGERKWEGAEL